jgi:NTE family protein
MQQEKKKIGLALGGGGARGLCHIGVLKVLAAEGIKVDAISGTSIGALIGAIYSVGTPLEELEDYVRSLDWKSYLLFAELSFTGKGIINSRKVEEILDKFLKEKTFADCKIDFNCVSLDLLTRQKTLFSSGNLKEAVRASMSIPGLFDPVCMKEKLLVDGGMVEPLPTRSLKKLGPDLVIASMVSFKKEKAEPVLKNDDKKINTRYIIDTSFNIMQEEMAKKDTRAADIVIASRTGDFGFLDFVSGAKIIARGETAARKKIAAIKKKMGISSG